MRPTLLCCLVLSLVACDDDAASTGAPAADASTPDAPA